MKTELMTVGAGCLWGVQSAFDKIKGVLSTIAGYEGGETKNPFYEDVCSNKTGHAEVVQIEFNPKKISYEKLLKIFWEIHDPTQLNKQGPDIGSQYRSIIFYHNEEQRKMAENSKNEMQKMLSNKIATIIKKSDKFYKAEDYHQNFLNKRNWRMC